MRKRDYLHPDSTQYVKVVRQGVDLTITRAGTSITAELTQMEAVGLGIAILYRAGIRMARIKKDKVGDGIEEIIEFFPTHPFAHVWDAPELRDGNAEPSGGGEAA